MAEGPDPNASPVLKKLTNLEDDAGFPFADIIFSENIMPEAFLQEIEPPLTIHLKTHYAQSENEKNPPTLPQRIEIAENRKKKKKKKKEKDENTTEGSKEEDPFSTPPPKGCPLRTFCPRSLELEHGWIQCLWPGNHRKESKSSLIFDQLIIISQCIFF